MLPGAGVRNGEEYEKRILALYDDFRGHSSAGCKAFNTGHTDHRNILKWVIMKCGLTSVRQPLDKVVNKGINRFIHDVYDVWALTVPLNPTTGASLTPTRQQVTSWVVQTWDRIPGEICAKSWTECGYKKNK